VLRQVFERRFPNAVQGAPGDEASISPGAEFSRT
jgi:hypothetical protein